MTIVSVTATQAGVTITLTESGGVWTGTLTAPSKSSGSNNSGQGVDIGAEAQGKGYYPITITLTDDVGNVTTIDSTDPTWGETLRLKVLEKTGPTAVLSYPTAGAYINNRAPEIKWTITDTGSGVNPNAVFVKIDNGNAIAVTPTINGGTATATYVPSPALTDGEHTVEVYGSDFDGNQSAIASAAFTIDGTNPTLNITNPSEETTRTNVAAITLTGTVVDQTGVQLKITHGTKTYNPTITGGAWSQAITLSNGSNTITFEVTDAAGNKTTATRIVVLDTAAPTVTNVELTENPVDVGKTTVIKVTATDA